MPYLFGWSEPLIPNSGSASEGERPDRSDPPLPTPTSHLKAPYTTEASQPSLSWGTRCGETENGAPWSLRAAPALGALSGTGMQRERPFPPGHRAASRGRREQSRGPAASARSAPGSSRRGQLPSPRPFSCLHLSPRAQHCPALGPCRSLRTACPLRCGGPVQSPGPPRPRSALWAGGRVLGEAFLQAAKPYPDQMGGPALGGPGRCH
ncbi:uncharacterized protein LOC100718363 isoform X2 [Cavia porcellus]|uniref:uncharacterized protein LOC100718363 isoform X2 n=1 Tax=Cavia porcellus TaxID=10141 RepID=UPI002FDF1138